LRLADTTRAVPTTGATPIRTCSTSSATTPTSLATARFMRYDTGGASTAARAARRTSIRDLGSSSDCSTDAAVMVASRSRTGVSDAAVLM
jgi:hypothetical protein